MLSFVLLAPGCVSGLDKVKLGYLLLYNGIQWSGFILIVLALLKAVRGGMGKWDTPSTCHTM